MATDEDVLRHVVRAAVQEEIGVAVRAALNAPDLRRLIERFGTAMEAVDKALTKLDRFQRDPELSRKRKAAAQARWGTTVPGSRAARLTVARRHGTHTEKEWIGMLEVLDYRCVACGNEGVVKDHIIPIRLLTASDAIENLQPMCRPCNTGKGNDQVDMRPKDWRERLDKWLADNQSKEFTKVVEGSIVYARSALIQKKAKVSKINAKDKAADQQLSTGLPTLEAPPPGPATAPPGTRVFLDYAAAFKERYGEFPVRNAKSSSLLKQLVGRLGADEAPPVAAYYVGLNDKLYAGSGHCLSLLLRDAEKLRTLWKQGAQGTTEAPARPWWETWTALQAQGDELGIEHDENPTVYRFAVLRAAFVAGRLPEPIARKLGVDNEADPGA